MSHLDDLIAEAEAGIECAKFARAEAAETMQRSNRQIVAYLDQIADLKRRKSEAPHD